jgi:hypothetical protein
MARSQISAGLVVGVAGLEDGTQLVGVVRSSDAVDHRNAAGARLLPDRPRRLARSLRRRYIPPPPPLAVKWM